MNIGDIRIASTTAQGLQQGRIYRITDVSRHGVGMLSYQTTSLTDVDTGQVCSVINAHLLTSAPPKSSKKKARKR